MLFERTCRLLLMERSFEYYKTVQIICLLNLLMDIFDVGDAKK